MGFPLNMGVWTRVLDHYAHQVEIVLLRLGMIADALWVMLSPWKGELVEKKQSQNSHWISNLTYIACENNVAQRYVKVPRDRRRWTEKTTWICKYQNTIGRIVCTEICHQTEAAAQSAINEH